MHCNSDWSDSGGAWEERHRWEVGPSEPDRAASDRHRWCRVNSQEPEVGMKCMVMRGFWASQAVTRGVCGWRRCPRPVMFDPRVGRGDLFAEPQELVRAMRGRQVRVILPVVTSSAANRVVVPHRTWSWVRFSAGPGASAGSRCPTLLRPVVQAGQTLGQQPVAPHRDRRPGRPGPGHHLVRARTVRGQQHYAGPARVGHHRDRVSSHSPFPRTLNRGKGNTLTRP